MIIRKAEFIKSAADNSGIDNTTSPQFAMCGRSNVGKSSFINMITNNGKLAKTSKDPGRTRLINYFSINDGQFILVDLPGYGYAKVSKEEKDKWGIMIEDYLNHSQQLKGVFMLLDIRHPPTADDIIMINYLHSTARPFTLIATKADKLSRAQIQAQVKVLSASLRVGAANIIPISSTTRYGKDAILAKIAFLLDSIKDPSYLSEEDQQEDQQEDKQKDYQEE